MTIVFFLSSLCHLSEWFRILATHPSVAEDLYSVSSFLATTGMLNVSRFKDRDYNYSAK